MKKMLIKLLLLTFSVILIQSPISNSVASAQTLGLTCSLYTIAQYGDNTINIESETLTFKSGNLNSLPDTLISEYIITGKENTSAQIVLPIFGQLMDDFRDYKVTFNGTEIAPQINYSLQTSLEDFSGDFLTKTYNAPYIFDENLCGTLYTFISSEPFSVSFILEKEQKIIHGGFSGSWSKQGGDIKTECILSTANFRYEDFYKCTIYVSSGVLNFVDTPSTLGDVAVLSYNDYLLNYYIEEYPSYYLHATNTFKSYLDNRIDLITDLIPQNTYLLFLMYDIDITNPSNVLKLERPLQNFNGYGDDNPITYRVINSPVRTFSSFGNTQINITSNKLPSMSETRFEKVSDSTYSYCGNLTNRDQYEIVLDYDKGNNNSNQLFWLYISLGIAACAAVITLLVIILIKKDKSRINYRKNVIK